MKKILVIDGTDEDVKKLSDAAKGYEISAVSSFDMNGMALSAVISIANTIDSRDVYSSGRLLRTAVIARDIAENLGWSSERCDNIYYVALLHDIGMIAVDDSILKKPARLMDLEYEAVKRHPAAGAEMLRNITILENLSDGALYHHERWDGSGYPKGLSGDEIPECARVLAIADAYDAMSSDRVYRSMLSHDKIINEFTRCAGSQFDPEMAEVFVFMLKGGYHVDPDIEQTTESRLRAAADGSRHLFTLKSDGADETEDGRDSLTGMFSRSYLNARVGKNITEQRSGALMMIAVTGFSALASSDPKTGDEVIGRFSERLRSYFREADILCRIDDDRFAVFVSGESGKGVIEKKAAMTADLIGDDEILCRHKDSIGTAIGISMCMEDGITFEELYGAAADALDAAIEQGGRYVFAGT
ncbi:MAG: HD domain-containing protein [Lachnospiraceae bacterium]|nr:HD domain-containing protein [Lachnospiraceae bacterium]